MNMLTKLATLAALCSTLAGCATVGTNSSRTATTATAAAAALATPDTSPTAEEFQRGKASWYSMGHTTANGEPYNPDGISAAHPSLPFGTMVRVTNLDNGKTVDLRINDRGPFHGGRVVDLSRGAARQVGMITSGTANVALAIIAKPAKAAPKPVLAYR